LSALISIIDDQLSTSKELLSSLSNEPQIRHQIEQLVEIRNKLNEQFDVNLHLRFLLSNLMCFFSSKSKVHHQTM